MVVDHIDVLSNNTIGQTNNKKSQKNISDWNKKQYCSMVFLRIDAWTKNIGVEWMDSMVRSDNMN